MRTKNLRHLEQRAERTCSLRLGPRVPLAPLVPQIPTAPWTTEWSGDIKKDYVSLLSFVQFCLLPGSFSIRLLPSLPSTLRLLSGFIPSATAEKRKNGEGPRGTA